MDMLLPLPITSLVKTRFMISLLIVAGVAHIIYTVIKRVIEYRPWCADRVSAAF